jgi:hypothetical protein
MPVTETTAVHVTVALLHRALGGPVVAGAWVAVALPALVVRRAPASGDDGARALRHLAAGRPHARALLVGLLHRISDREECGERAFPSYATRAPESRIYGLRSLEIVTGAIGM